MRHFFIRQRAPQPQSRTDESLGALGILGDGRSSIGVVILVFKCDAVADADESPSRYFGVVDFQCSRSACLIGSVGGLEASLEYPSSKVTDSTASIVLRKFFHDEFLEGTCVMCFVVAVAAINLCTFAPFLKFLECLTLANGYRWNRKCIRMY